MDTTICDNVNVPMPLDELDADTEDRIGLAFHLAKIKRKELKNGDICYRIFDSDFGKAGEIRLSARGDVSAITVIAASYSYQKVRFMQVHTWAFLRGLRTHLAEIYPEWLTNPPGNVVGKEGAIW